MFEKVTQLNEQAKIEMSRPPILDIKEHRG